MVLASSLLEQAAKEVGGSYTNRREVTGANGGPMEVRGLADFYADLAPKPEPGAS